MTAVQREGKCERCGWQLVLVDMLALARQYAGITEDTCSTPKPGAEWCEVHRLDEGGTTRLSLQPHTPTRCQRRRIGDPEPFEWHDGEDDDEDGDDW